MKNIFDFATKELSQDAFLSWFIASYDEPEVSEYSYEFINFLTGYHFINVGDIKKVAIKQQCDGIDVVVDFWTNDDLHYVLIIEDKTTSSAHTSQLEKYAKTMDGWNNNEEGYINRRRKVFYKVNHLTDQDKKELEIGNKKYDESDKWRVFDINKIYSFFSNIKETESQILNSYALHIKQIYKDLNEVSDLTINEWNYVNFETFFRNVINEEFKKRDWPYSFNSGMWHGKVLSAAFYYYPKNEKLNKITKGGFPSFAYPFIEFVYRKYSNEILIYSHISYHWYDDKKDKNEPNRYTWKWSEYEPNIEEAKAFMEEVKKAIKEKVDVKVRKMESKSSQSISKDSIKITKSKEELEKAILDKLEIYFEAFKIADERY